MKVTINRNIDDDIILWFVDNGLVIDICTKDVFMDDDDVVHYRTSWAFDNEADAMLFKLCWGGV